MRPIITMVIQLQVQMIPESPMSFKIVSHCCCDIGDVTDCLHEWTPPGIGSHRLGGKAV
jgi:hypothetical protein